jgi:murein DD-endopeptidase MepM/ murein hydrolase activator NlpD
MEKAIRYNSGLHFFSSLEMKLPVNGLISSEFGVKRFINDNPRNPHLGTDIPANIGTLIKAPLAGKIILVGDFFYRGRVIFIDHGAGLISSYSHLNDVYVKKDQEIISGTILGEVGKTGRVTGPHLHWQIYLKGISVDPEIFLP